MTQAALINNLTQDVENIISVVDNELKSLNIKELNWKENVDKWSILECIEHLNRYNAYYNTNIRKALMNEKRPSLSGNYMHGWFGNMSINLMKPSNEKKQKTISRMNPADSQLGKDTLQRFIVYQKELLALLASAKTVNIASRKVPVEFFKLIKLRIGDALAFVVTHEQRHILQAQNVLKAMTKSMKEKV